MARNTIQFQKGMSIKRFFGQYGTEQQCREELERLRWPQGFICGKCGHTGYCVNKKRQVYQCHRCHYQKSLTAGTIFHSSKLPLTTWFLGIYLMTQNKNGISALELRKQLGISYNAAWRMKQKLMQVMLERDSGKRLEGEIIIDDAYLGGERTGGRRGRGSEDKTPFVVAVETNKEGHPIRIKLSKIETFSKKEIEKWSAHHLQVGSSVISDGLKCFNGVEAAGCEHTRFITGSGKAAVKFPVFQWLNTILGNVKNSLAGTYHACYSKHAPRYLAEFQYRFNRRFDLPVMIPRLVYVAARSKPLPERLLTVAENSC